jgi:DNA-binding GntR family transcriptional regulator
LRLRAGESRLPLGQVVTDELRRAILSGRYQPGERLIEDRLSEELGISRVPVRKALRQLAGDGLVELGPNRGATVANVSDDTARDLIEVRATLEGLNAKLTSARYARSRRGTASCGSTLRSVWNATATSRWRAASRCALSMPAIRRARATS